MSSLSLACVVSEARACVRSQPFCVPVGSWLRPSSSDNWLYSWPRSLASLEDVVTHGLQSLLESPSRLVAPVSSVEQAQRTPLPKAVPGRPRGSILLSRRGPTSSSVKSCPRLLPTARFPPTTGLAPWPPLLAVVSLGGRPARPAPLLRPSLVRRLLLLPPGRLVEVAPLAPLRLGVASVTSRFSVKTSLAAQCGSAAPTHHLMMMSTIPIVAPHLLSGPSCSASSPLHSPAGSPWTFTPLANRTTLRPLRSSPCSTLSWRNWPELCRPQPTTSCGGLPAWTACFFVELSLRVVLERQWRVFVTFCRPWCSTRGLPVFLVGSSTGTWSVGLLMSRDVLRLTALNYTCRSVSCPPRFSGEPRRFTVGISAGTWPVGRCLSVNGGGVSPWLLLFDVCLHEEPSSMILFALVFSRGVLHGFHPESHMVCQASLWCSLLSGLFYGFSSWSVAFLMLARWCNQTWKSCRQFQQFLSWTVCGCDQFPFGIGASFGDLLFWSTFALFNVVGLFAFGLYAGQRGVCSQFRQFCLVSQAWSEELVTSASLARPSWRLLRPDSSSRWTLRFNLELEALGWASEAAAYSTGGRAWAWAARFSGEAIVKVPDASLVFLLKKSKVCPQIVLKCLYLARIGRPDILWSVNKFARSVTEWIQACDRRLARLISYIHHTHAFRQYYHVGNTVHHCRLDFKTQNLQGILKTQNPHQAEFFRICGSPTFVPIS